MFRFPWTKWREELLCLLNRSDAKIWRLETDLTRARIRINTLEAQLTAKKKQEWNDWLESTTAMMALGAIQKAAASTTTPPHGAGDPPNCGGTIPPGGGAGAIDQ